mgnify:CR=1 FL=1
MTQLEKFKRWAERQGCFLLWEEATRIGYILPTGETAFVSINREGDLEVNV